MANGILDDAEPDFNLPKVADFVWNPKEDSDCIKSPNTKSTTAFTECFSPETNDMFGGISAQAAKGHSEVKECRPMEPSTEQSIFSIPSTDQPDKNIAQGTANIQTPKLLNA